MRENNVDMKPLSREACTEIAEWGDKVIRDAVKHNRLVPDSVYEAPEVLQARINYTVGQIVNKALHVAHEEWTKADDSCAYCLEYEHGMKPVSVKCTCPNHCGAMVCPAPPDVEVFAKCPHEPYRGTPRCAVMECPNYAGKHVRNDG